MGSKRFWSGELDLDVIEKGYLDRVLFDLECLPIDPQ